MLRRALRDAAYWCACVRGLTRCAAVIDSVDVAWSSARCVWLFAVYEMHVCSQFVTSSHFVRTLACNVQTCVASFPCFLSWNSERSAARREESACDLKYSMMNPTVVVESRVNTDGALGLSESAIALRSSQKADCVLSLEMF